MKTSKSDKKRMERRKQQGVPKSRMQIDWTTSGLGIRKRKKRTIDVKSPINDRRLW